MTSTPSSSPSTRRPRVIGILALIGAAVLSASYFTYGTSFHDIRTQWGMFYTHIRPGWILTRASEIDHAFDTNPDAWTTMFVRAAYGRWRLRPLAPEPFDDIMKEYEHGWWLCPSKEVWESKFKQYDETWEKKRKEAMADKKALAKRLAIQFSHPNKDEILVRFPTHPYTFETGSRLTLLVDSTPDSVPKTPIRVFWSTEKAPGRAAYRRRLATWHTINGAPKGKQRLSIDVDLSWEPVWMYSGSRATSLWYDSPGAAKWTIAGVLFGDDPLLTDLRKPHKAP